MFKPLITPLIELTTQVGEVIMSFYKRNTPVQIKPDQTPFTIADKKAHRLVSEGLNRLTPNTAILSEESKTIPFEQRSKWREYWLVDPLDGTRDFLEQTGEFCVCIAYIKDHLPVFGMIYAPLSKTHYYTIDGTSVKQKNNRLYPLKTRTPSSVLKVILGRHSPTTPVKNHLKQYKNYKVTHLGSALKFCRIAEGDYDYYPKFGPCSEWDTAAGAYILQNAGGSVVGQDGQPLRYNTKADLLSPIFFASGKP